LPFSPAGAVASVGSRSGRGQALGGGGDEMDPAWLSHRWGAGAGEGRHREEEATKWIQRALEGDVCR